MASVSLIKHQYVVSGDGGTDPEPRLTLSRAADLLRGLANLGMGLDGVVLFIFVCCLNMLYYIHQLPPCTAVQS